MNNLNNTRIYKRNYVRCRMCHIQILYNRIQKCNKCSNEVIYEKIIHRNNNDRDDQMEGFRQQIGVMDNGVSYYVYYLLPQK